MSVVIPEPSVAGIVTATLDESIDISIDVPPDTESMEYVRGHAVADIHSQRITRIQCISNGVSCHKPGCWCLYYCLRQ